ncbi:hemolysin family protein [Rhodococcus aerolatus]
MEWLLIGAALVLVVACGLFVAAEFALVTVSRPTLEAAADAGDRRAAGGVRALRTLSTQLSGAQLGITVTNLGIGFLAEPSIAALTDGPLEALGLGPAAASTVSVLLALVLATALTMIFGELVPKNLAIARPVETVRAVQCFQRAFTRATAWPLRFFNGTANRVLGLVGLEPQEELASARSPQELVSLVARSAERGTLPATTATLVTRTLAFGDRRAADVMTPRVRLHTLAPTDPVTAVYERATATGHSRFPVVDGDDVVGVVHVKHVVDVDPADRADTPVSAVMATDLVLVPSSVELDALLERLRDTGLQLAVVIDEFGGVDGIVTVEDLVEELVGEVRDEHDSRAEAAVRRRPDGSLDLSGLLRPDEASAALGAALPESAEYETLAGLVAERLGRVPEVGDEVVLELSPPGEEPVTVTLRVATTAGLRVDRVVASGSVNGTSRPGSRNHTQERSS